VAAGELGRQRGLHEREDGDDVLAALAGERQVVEVDDRHVGLAAEQRPDRGGGAERLRRAQVDALGVVVAALQREVEAGVDRARPAVEQQRRVLVRAAVAVPTARAAAARRQRGEGENEGEDGPTGHGRRSIGRGGAGPADSPA
jgi:hypothetical protein